MKYIDNPDAPNQKHLDFLRIRDKNNTLIDFDQLSHLCNSNFQIGITSYFILPVFQNNSKATNIRLKEYLHNQRIEVGTDSIQHRIHKDDLAFYLQCEQKTNEFFSRLAPSEIPFYKTRFDFRVGTNGFYKRYLQQRVVFEYENENIRNFLVIMTDISQLKSSSSSHYSIIGKSDKKCPDSNYPPSIKVADPFPLSRREKDVHGHLMENLSSKEIADKLFVSEETIKNHRKGILKKTGCKNTLELIMKSYENGWI
ncbi:response regulator transcription factor [Cryomorpha ignava]|uniref:Response regulator transcription factor n=1 Tax=Cryomorpha ignava TaxID=101383 RepID=A0A7K3WTC8_9FLAO|nr:LuxR C-terminal-related transcriptional regulator [Cryomorpha ignava]NEN24132.1 response regulator transcription factor [Cryomorpha ignava]